MWVTDALTNKLLKYDLDGRLLYSWGTFGGEPGQFCGPHHLSTDSEGNLDVTEVWGGACRSSGRSRGPIRTTWWGSCSGSDTSAGRTLWDSSRSVTAYF